MCTIPEPHQGAVLSVAQIGDAHGQPQSDGGQCNREGTRSRICEHPVAKVVRLVGRPFVMRRMACFVQEVRLGSICRDPLFGQSCEVTRPELEHDVLFLRYHGPLCFHRTRSANSDPLLSRCARSSHRSYHDARTKMPMQAVSGPAVFGGRSYFGRRPIR